MSKAFIVNDIGFGDGGKGTVTDFLTHRFKSDLTVRFSGGCQAGHNVVNSEGKHHTFSQFGSGTFQGARTLISKYMMVNPLSLLRENEHLRSIGFDNNLSQIYIDENCLVTTPTHGIVNRIIEGKNQHGSCGVGIGECMSDSIKRPNEVLRMGDLKNKDLTLDKLIRTEINLGKKISEDLWGINLPGLARDYLDFTRLVKIISYEESLELIKNSNSPVFEGAQGVLLDENWGTYPHNTWSATTSKNAVSLLTDCNWEGEIDKIGVMRTFLTRHGNGPLPTEEKSLDCLLNGEHNEYGKWQGNFRTGWLDFELLKYSEEIDDFDYLAATHTDKLGTLKEWNICSDYQNYKLRKLPVIDLEKQEKITKGLFYAIPNYQKLKSSRILGAIEEELSVKIKIMSFGPKTHEKTLDDSLA